MLALQQSHKDYLIAIYMIAKRNKGGWISNIDISEFLGVTPASVSGMLEKLKKQNLVSWEPRRKIRLTLKGKLIAMESIEINSLLKAFFMENLKLSDDPSLDLLCSKIGNYITPQILNALKSKILE